MRKNKMNQVNTTTTTEENLLSNLQDRRVVEAREQIENEEVEKTTDLKATPADAIKVTAAVLGAYAGLCAVTYGTAYAAAKILPPAAQKLKSLLCFTRDKAKKAFSSTNSSYSKMNNEELNEKAKALIGAMDQLEKLIQKELEVSGGKFTPEINDHMRIYKHIGRKLDPIMDALGGVVHY